MSASIYWRPVAKSRKSVSTYTPSSFIESIRKAFGEFPVKLDTDSLPVLQGMAAVEQMPGNGENPYEQLVEAINQIGSIEVWAEY